MIFLNIAALISICFLFIVRFEIHDLPIIIFTRISISLLILNTLIVLIRRRFSVRSLLSSLTDIVFIIIGLTFRDSERVFQFYLLGRQSVFLIRNFSYKQTDQKFYDKLMNNPPVLVLLSFLFAIFIGTLLLLLPVSTVPGKVTSFIGALFSSTSATCVTGLIVYDTGTHFTIFGQSVLLFLIQVGGLGIMTVSSAFAILLGQRLTVRSENLMQSVVGQKNKVDMISLMKNILFVTLFFEIIGTIFFYLTFRNNLWSHQKTIFHSVYHSISAFCNAGFCLYRDNLMAYRSSISINVIVTSLIIIGGIGFPVIVDVRRNLSSKFRFSRLSLHTKIVLSSTLVLLIIGTVAFFISEYNSEMKGFSFPDRIMSSYFQSVTTRTAGFNTIDNCNLSDGSVFISSILMFIGASPGSTGGGVKTTAFAIILISVFAMFKGNNDVNIFYRKITDRAIKKVMALIAASLSFLIVMIFILLLTEPFGFQRIIFEAFSAYGTVGLSMGITSQLSAIGKFIIIILMYLGRVGPLTLIFALSELSMKTSYNYPEERISIE